MSYPAHSLGGVLPLCREAVSVFYSPSRLGNAPSDFHLSFQEIHHQVPQTTSSVMFFPSSLGVSGLSTSYTFTKVTQLVSISHQLVVRNLPVTKKKWFPSFSFFTKCSEWQNFQEVKKPAKSYVWLNPIILKYTSHPNDLNFNNMHENHSKILCLMFKHLYMWMAFLYLKRKILKHEI